MINEALPIKPLPDDLEDANGVKKPPDWELPFSLPLLFFTSQFDITLQTYNYQFSEPYVHADRPQTCLRSKPSAQLLPKLKRNLTHVLQNAKHKVTKALHCLPCIRTEIEPETKKEIEPPTTPIQRREIEVVTESSPPVTATNDDEDDDDDDNDNGKPQERLRTISETIDSGISTLSDPQISSSSDPDVFSSSDSEWESRDVASGWLTKTVAEGRCCFQESKLLASHGLLQVDTLRQNVAVTRHQLQAALVQLWTVEMGLHDFRWEAVDRDSWTQHLLPTTGSTLFAINRHQSTLSLSSLGFESDADYLWEWSLV